MNNELFTILITGSATAIAVGLLGRFVILRNLSLAADVLSHVALPGIALGLWLNASPFLGALIFLILATTVIWWIETRTDLQIDAIIGIFFVTSLAIGALFIPDEELLESLFGSIEQVTEADMILSLLIAGGVLLILKKLQRGFLLTTISPEVATVSKINVALNKLALLLLIALAVAIGIKITGIILIAALLIIPAATAQNLSSSFKTYSWLTVAVALLSTVSGLLVAFATNTDPGPPIIIISTGLFLLSLFARFTQRH